MPDWHSKNAKDKRGLITWDAVQYIGLVEINGSLTEALLDTGGHGTIIDHESALELGLDVTLARNGNFGHYRSPGYKPRAYHGIVQGPVEIRFNKEVVTLVPFIRIIDSPRRQIIIGADVLCGGRDILRWNFYSMPIVTNPDGTMQGYITFKCRQHFSRIPLLNVPCICGHLPPP